MDVYVYKKKELQLSYFSICEGKKLDDKIVTYFALKTGSTVFLPRMRVGEQRVNQGWCPYHTLRDHCTFFYYA